MNVRNKDDGLSLTGRPFQPCQIFVRKARSLQQRVVGPELSQVKCHLGAPL
jgi:hypothetical protein